MGLGGFRCWEYGIGIDVWIVGFGYVVLNSIFIIYKVYEY